MQDASGRRVHSRSASQHRNRPPRLPMPSPRECDPPGARDLQSIHRADRVAMANHRAGDRSPDHLVLLRGADMEAWESESPMAAVTLPLRPPPPPPGTLPCDPPHPSTGSMTVIGTLTCHPQQNNVGSLPLPPRGKLGTPPARPPALSRTASLPPALPPAVPPRPESTLTSASRRLSPSRPKPKTPVTETSPPVTETPQRHTHLPPLPLPTAGPVLQAMPGIASLRPEHDRVQNLYVETPQSPQREPASRRFFPSRSTSGSTAPKVKTTRALLPHQHHQKKSLSSVHSGRNRSKDGNKTANECDNVTVAPNARTNVPAGLVNAGAQQGLPNATAKQVESIICIECGKCKCNACQAPKKLPEKWLCNGNVKCSPDSVVDALSCMCCVRAALYHCGKDSDEESADEPCSCAGGARAAARWSCMALMSLVVPCLWCYLPLRGCAKATQAVYQRCNASACQCPKSAPRWAPVVPAVISSEPVSVTSVTSSTSIASSPKSATDTSSILSSPLSMSPVDAKQRLLE